MKAQVFHRYNRVAVLRGWPLLSVHSASWDSIMQAASRLMRGNADVANQLIHIAKEINY